jgi:hypothetical protein
MPADIQKYAKTYNQNGFPTLFPMLFILEGD